VRGFALLAVLLLTPIASVRSAWSAPQVQATLSAGSVEVGAGVTLVVAVTDPAGATGDPQFTLPAGLQLLGSEQGSSFSWVNGRSSNRIEYRYAIGTDQVGRFAIAAIRVRVGRQVFECPTLSLNVTPAVTRDAPQAHGAAGASLVVEVRPSRGYVGQLMQLSMKLVQTRDLTQTGSTVTPTTSGFWVETYGDPIETRASAGGRPATVTERRMRIYPLAPGRATVGSAALVVSVASGGDPFLGGAPPRPVEIRSEPVRVEVLPLPAGAPAGFANGVGSFTADWRLDRGHTTKDQALTLQLDVRGIGNLPLLHTPALALPDFDVYASTVDDSFGPAGEVAAGRRRFQWTLLPHRTGALRLEPPALAWFDPGAAAYHRAALAPLEVEVLAAGPASSADRDANAFPPVFGRDGARPGGRAARPWVFAIAGVLAGLAVQLWRRASVPDALAADRARARELLRAVGLAHGPDFWSAADEAAAWVESRGGQVLRLREEIAAARYSGRPLREDDVRPRLVERVAEALPASTSRAPGRALAALLGVLAAGALVFGAGARGGDALAARSLGADGLARAAHIDEARSAWTALWREAPGDPALAARLAWSELRRERPAAAAVWALRGMRGEARNASLDWTVARVREAGGLVGAPGEGLPLRALEWAALAFALALGALLEWPRRWSALALGLLALVVAGVLPVSGWLASRAHVAVVARTAPLAGADVDLDPGQVVHILRVNGASVHVRAARGLAGDVPADALLDTGEGAR
jgi:hypothetical protein